MSLNVTNHLDDKEDYRGWTLAEILEQFFSLQDH